MVAEESLVGQGAGISYLFPTRSNLFAQLDLGTWSGDEPGESSNLPDILTGPGAAFADKFNTARLWVGYPFGDNTEVELGGSYSSGDAEEQFIEGSGRAKLTGMDLSYRRFGEGNSRLLLRGETVRRRESVGSERSSAGGYYLSATTVGTGTTA